jgi:hypothetical protein
MDEVIRRVGRNRLSAEVAPEFVQAGRTPDSSEQAASNGNVTGQPGAQLLA